MTVLSRELREFLVGGVPGDGRGETTCLGQPDGQGGWDGRDTSRSFCSGSQFGVQLSRVQGSMINSRVWTCSLEESAVFFNRVRRGRLRSWFGLKFGRVWRLGLAPN